MACKYKQCYVIKDLSCVANGGKWHGYKRAGRYKIIYLTFQLDYYRIQHNVFNVKPLNSRFDVLSYKNGP